LELDYLRLVYAAKEHKRKGLDSGAFLLVMTPEIANRVETWNKKYDAEGVVNVVTAIMSVSQKEAMSEEKKNNIQGMVALTRRSISTLGRTGPAFSNSANPSEEGRLTRSLHPSK